MSYTAKNQDYFVCALYHFVVLEDYEALRERLLTVMQQHNVRGTLLLAREGVNGTIAGSREGVDSVLGFLKSDSRFAELKYKESLANKPPFHRTKVKLKNEIVTMGLLVEGAQEVRSGCGVAQEYLLDLVVDFVDEFPAQIGLVQVQHLHLC